MATIDELRSSSTAGFDYLFFLTDEGLLQRFRRDHHVVQWHGKNEGITCGYPADENSYTFITVLMDGIKGHVSKYYN
jgi:hypothetical protein